MSQIIHGDCLEVISELPDESVDCVVTSPPYLALRDYGTAEWVGGSSECKHIKSSNLKRDVSGGYTGKDKGTRGQQDNATSSAILYSDVCKKCGAERKDSQLGLEKTPQEYVDNLVKLFSQIKRVLKKEGTVWLNLGDTYAGSGHNIKPKDLAGIPWRTAFALQDDGWYLRQDIIWCLSGGTKVYARTQKGDMPMTLKDLARLDPETVKLWSGERWTQLLGLSKSRRKATELSLVLRSGERIVCTPTHKFPTSRGLLEASAIKIGDCLVRVRIPESESPKTPEHITDDAAWLAGLYLAEGSMSGDTIQIAGHRKEQVRWNRVQRVAEAYGGSATRTIAGNSMEIRVYGRLLVALIRELVSGNDAHHKHIANVVWRYNDSFLFEYLRGYLDGDGHWDEKNKRWRLGFCRNYALEQDLHTACARLGLTLTLRPTTSRYQGGMKPSFRGEIRIEKSGHYNEKSRDEVMRIEKGRCRWVYDLGVADEPHLFALSSGVLTHNSKPNPMPESVTDRCTKAHEYIFLLTKSPRYYFDQDAIREKAVIPHNPDFTPSQKDWSQFWPKDESGKAARTGNPIQNTNPQAPPGGRNKRSVWTVTTKPFKGAHFATFPEKLISPMILAGCPEKGIVLDPFFGAGTTGLVAKKLGREYIGIELNGEYIKLAEDRLKQGVLL